MKILIIGLDSFIAKCFYKRYSESYCLNGISRIGTGNTHELVIDNLNEINQSLFEGIDSVLNFAAIVHRPEIKSKELYDEINHKLAILNAQKAKQAGVKIFIQMSTIAVYGNTQRISINTLYHPLGFYGKSKLKADEELIAMQDENFKVAIVRPPMVYGGGKAPGNMMRLIKLADKGIPLPFKGIDNKRDFINVHNLVQYLGVIVEKRLNGIHLISDQEPVSTEYLLQTIAEHLGKKVPLFKVPELGLKMLKKIRPNEFEKLFGTLSIDTNFRFEELIDRYTIEDGLIEMLESYKENRKTS